MVMLNWPWVLVATARKPCSLEWGVYLRARSLGLQGFDPMTVMFEFFLPAGLGLTSTAFAKRRSLVSGSGLGLNDCLSDVDLTRFRSFGVGGLGV